MKSVLITAFAALVLCFSSSASASPCEYILDVNSVNQQVSLRIQDNESKLWTRIDFPPGAYPLQAGMKIQFKSSFSSDDQATIEYDGQTLVYIDIARSNFTKEKVVMETTPDLKQIGSVDYKRRLLYGMSLLQAADTFSCRN